MKPVAKRDGLLSEDLEEELIVYDQDLHRGHCLNRTAALVWRHADGQRTIADLVAILQAELDPVADENLVWHALDTLNAAHLLEDPQPRSKDEMRASRRRFISKVGVVGVATLLLPLVTSVVPPRPVQAGNGSGSSSGSSGIFSPLPAEWLEKE
jgi:hypothetical protein